VPVHGQAEPATRGLGQSVLSQRGERMASRARVASKTRFFEAAREWRAADVAAMATARALVEAGADVNAIHEIRDDGEIFRATALWQALAWGKNRALGAYLLERGCDPNRCLFALVWNDDLAGAKLVRRYGADLDELGHGETPLIYALRHRRWRFAEWLLREGADAARRDRRGFTALHHAVRRRLPSSTLRLLTRRGADVHAAADGGATIGSLATRAQRRLLGID
jgi:hypothetical protein